MRLLVTGHLGMLGQDVVALAAAQGRQVAGMDAADPAEPIDIADLAAVRAAMQRLRPDAVIHCAAYTRVDDAEREYDLAYRVNAVGSWVVATACAETGVPICGISTDYVFDGESARPYGEWDATNPLSAYGATKLAGENAIRQANPRHWVVRTAWLYGLQGRCFPATMLNAAAQGKPLRVVADQYGCPTFTQDLAETLLRIVDGAPYGTYHATNSGSTSWYRFAGRILAEGGSPTRVQPIATAQWPTPARRPRRSELAPCALRAAGLPALRPWEEAIRDYVRQRRDMEGGVR